MKPCCAEILGEILGYGDKFLGSYVINVIVIVN